MPAARAAATVSARSSRYLRSAASKSSLGNGAPQPRRCAVTAELAPQLLRGVSGAGALSFAGCVAVGAAPQRLTVDGAAPSPRGVNGLERERAASLFAPAA